MRPMRSLKAAAATAGLVLAAPVIGAPTSGLAFVTQHSGVFGGQRLQYTATVERFLQRDAAAKPVLSLIVTSYVRDGSQNSARPVIFLFNGGPSGSSSGLHMELGPKSPQPEAATGERWPPSFVDNPDSPLDVADLVFFDPAETGFSRLLPGGTRSYYYSLEGDARSLARLIRAWVQRHGREHSPLYLLGESYGSVRAVVTAQDLQSTMPMSGIILFGNSLPIRETSDGIVGAATSLPMEALAAAYHHRADRQRLPLASFLDNVYDFAMGEYLPALAKGDSLPAEQARQIAGKLSAYTGISAGYYLSHHLMTPRPLANDTRELSFSALDPSVRVRQARSASHGAMRPDASRSVVGEYLRAELHVRLPRLQYREFAPDSFKSWDYGSGCDGWMRARQLCYPSQRTVFSDYDWPGLLARLFRTHAQFRTMIVAGYYDGLSSIGQTRFMLAHDDYPRDRLIYREYASGHATAADPKARAAVVRDIRSFVRAERVSGSR
jgi:Serine carboxypeptidase